MKAMCNSCGTEVDKRGLASHQRSYSCFVQTNARRARERGLERCGAVWSVIRSSGVPYEYVEDHIKEQGYSGRRTKTDSSLWAPAWAVAIAQCGRPVHERKEFLAWALEDKSLRLAIVALANVGPQS